MAKWISRKSFILMLTAVMLAASFTGVINPNLTTTAYAAAPINNLLANSGFEDDAGITAAPTGWKTIKSAGTVTTQALSQAGTYSVKITSTSKTGSFDSPAAGVYQTFTGLEQGTYTFSAWVKTSAYKVAAASGPDQSAYLEARNTGAPVMRSYVNGYPNADGWVQIVMRNVISYNGQATIGLYLQNAAAGMSVSMDDASFTLELSDNNPVQNWGFESDLNGWTAAGDAVIQSAEVDSGLKALNLAHGSKVSQQVALKPKTSYIASVRAKVKQSGGLVKIGVSGIDNSRSAPSATMGYSLLTVGFRTGESETSGSLYLESAGTGAATIDSIDLFELDDTIMKGVDISYVPSVEAFNGHYYANDVKQDFFDIMQNRGVNAVIPMTFVEAGNPTQGSSSTYNMLPGFFDKDDTIKLAERAKAHHMKFIASFQYSDGWMSAGKATKPLAWQNQSLEQLQTTMYNYNYDFLKSMADAGVEPDIVKIGNEENSGIVWDDGKIWSNTRAGFAKLVNAAYEAMKDVSPALRGHLHLNNGYDPATTNSWFDANTSAGITWDGQDYSLYGGRPTGSIYDMLSNNLKKWPDKDVIFVETGFSTTSTDYTPLVPNGSSITNGYYEKSERGQYNWLIDYMQALRDVPNPTDQQVGFFYWAADWIEKGDGYEGEYSENSPYLPGPKGHQWGNDVGDRTLFTYDGHALDGTYAYLWRGKPIAKPLGGELAFSDDSASYAVTPASVAGVTVKEKNVTIIAGKSKQLLATIAPADQVTNSNRRWTSSDTSVVKVDDSGIVTGVAAGTATITVVTEDGAFTDTATVTVTAAIPAGSLTLTGAGLAQDAMSLNIGQKSALQAALPVAVTNQIIKFTSSDPAVAGFLGEPVQTDNPGTLYQQSNVTSGVTVIAKKEGTATITASAMDGSASKTFVLTVAKVPVNTVTLDTTEVQLGVGRTKQLNAAIAPADASYQQVTWISSDENVATVSSTGLVTAKSVGPATITVTSEDGGKSAEASVTVMEVPTESITLNKNSLRLRAGDSESLTATVLPEDAKDKSVSWSTDDSFVATVSSNGIVTAAHNGQTTLTVTANDGGATLTIPIIVADVLNVTGVAVAPSAVTVEAGKTSQLTATLTPESADNPKVHWSSSDPEVASVNTNGQVLALKAGTALITATTDDGGYKADSIVTVTNVLSLGKSVTASKTGSSYSASSAVDNSDTTAWSPNSYTYGATLTVDLGQTAVIDSTRVYSWAASDFDVSVSEDGTNFTKIISHNDIVSSYDTAQAYKVSTTDPFPSGVYARYVKLTVNTVQKKGTAQQYTGIYDFKVYGKFVAPVESITLENAPSKLIIGDSAALSAIITPVNADPRLTWSSSNPGAVTVDQNGKVSAAILDGAQGEIVDTSDITLTAKSGISASKAIGVKVPIIVEGIGIQNNGYPVPDDLMNLAIGQQVQLTASIFQGSADYRSIVWSTDNPDIAAINAATGEVSAVGEGTAQITLTVDSYKNLPGGNEFSASIDIHVVTAPEAPANLSAAASSYHEIALNWDAVSDVNGYNVYRSDMVDGEYVKRNASVLTAHSYTDSGLTPSTTYYYKVTAVNIAGESPVSESEAATVTTNEAPPITVPVTGVTVSPASITLTAGDTTKLTATVAPLDATLQAVSWSSSDPGIAEVNASGVVTAKQEGSATITVTTLDGSFTSGSEVTVKEAPPTVVPVTGVAVSPSAITLENGSTKQFTAVVAPLDATNQAVSWSSSDTAVATVSSTGEVNAVAPGSTTITVTTADGSFTAVTTVTVQKSSNNSGNTGNGNTTPSTGVSSEVTVDQNGNLHVAAVPNSEGTAIFTIKQQDLDNAIDRMTGGTLDITIQTNADTKGVQVSIPSNQLERGDVHQITVRTGSSSVSFSTNLLNSSKLSNPGFIQLTVKTVNPASLPDEVSGILGDSQIYNFTLSIDGTPITTFKPQDQMEVALDYTLNPGENPKQIIVYYLSDNGELVVVKNGRYDEKLGKVIFKPAHFSQYAAAYSPVSFSDLASASWAIDAIQALAAREVIKGYTDGSFKPGAEVTRAEFLTMLMNAFDLVDPTAVSQFNDVKAGTWYSSSIASAEKLGIVKGKSDSSFGVNDTITRQEMAVMVYRAAELLGLEWKAGSANDTFADQSEIAGYAIDAITALKQSGLISGLGGNRFGPSLTTTRAEASVLIYNLFEQVK